MKERKNELNVDFIGGEAPLTKEEEKVISNFIAQSKRKMRKPVSRKKKRQNTSKITDGKEKM